jgi:transposase
MEKRVTLTMKEIKRLYVLQQIADKQLTGSQAAELLGLSLRQIRRLIAKYRAQGAPGIMHGNRGRVPNNRISERMRSQIWELAKEQYEDYNDSHFTEELEEKYGLGVSRSSVRRIRRENNQSSPRKHRTRKHRGRRARKPQAGMMLQTDGSRHDWLEGRGPWLTLIAYIDDATNQVSGAIFREEEDAAGYFLGLREICLTQGIPAAIYADQHTIFQSPLKATVAQELAGEQPRSQLGRLLDDLGIELIAAHSPQAKGRVERLWETFQDRLVKALREADASTLEQANQVLAAFVPRFNRRFQVQPEQTHTAYVPWPNEYRPEHFFCFKHIRTVANDNTISFDGHRLQIPPGPHRSSYAKAKVDVWQHLDGRLEVRYQGHSLVTFEPADHQPVRVLKFTPAPGQAAPQKQPAEPQPIKKPKVRTAYKPAADHPWRRPVVAKSKGKKS